MRYATTPIGALMIEHRLIERMVAVLDDRRGRLVGSGWTDPDELDGAVDFIRTHADRCHHGKEEDILFRELALKPLDSHHAIVMGGLVEEHVYGRATTARLAEANARLRRGDEEAAAVVAEALGDLVRFYPAHIEKEDKHFFIPAQEYLSEAEREAMLGEFKGFDMSLIHDRYRAAVEGWESRPGS